MSDLKTVVLPEPDLYEYRVQHAPAVGDERKSWKTVHSQAAPQIGTLYTDYYKASTVRALLATGGQARVRSKSGWTFEELEAQLAEATKADPENCRAVGEELLKSIHDNFTALKAAGWDGPVDSPVEVVTDLLNLLDEAKAAAPQAQALPYSLDLDPLGIRALTASAITGALSLGATGGEKPPAGHWLEWFYQAGAEQAPQQADARDALTPAARDVLAERARQINAEGYDPEHDDHHVNDEIAAMAALFLMPEGARDWDASSTSYGDTLGAAMLPCDWEMPNFGDDRRRQLVKGTAMGLAEIERYDRTAIAAAKGNEQ